MSEPDLAVALPVKSAKAALVWIVLAGILTLLALTRIGWLLRIFYGDIGVAARPCRKPSIICSLEIQAREDQPFFTSLRVTWKRGMG